MIYGKALGFRLNDAITTLLIAGCAGLMACQGRERTARFPGDTTGIVRPRALNDLSSVVSQLNAIVQADVRDISTAFDRCEGPRTVLHLRNVRSLLGHPHAGDMELRVFGGPLPDGRYARASESPRYVAGRRYLLFLFNTDWRFSPVIADLAFRLEPVARREVLVSPDGHGVTGVSALAVETQTRMLFLPQGLPGVGSVRVARTPETQFVPCGMNSDGSPRCPRLPVDSQPPRETFVAADPFIPRPPSAEDVINTIDSKELVRKIDSAATAIGVKPGGYFASRSRLECWDVVPSTGARK
ncbi:MAG: hypothetical protein H7Z74_06680 [Anaerolineae bacterium]|nr:hypothetical protein [Gemmatimonadaceae bacterium]